jgi:tyrosyl-tRNA synthetase
MTDLLGELGARGLLQDATPGLGARLAQGPITGYCGFDPTADSLHVGSLVPVMALAWLQRTGGRPLVLVGAGTGMVGDPSGKRAERPVLSVEEIDANAAAIRGQLERFLDFDGPRGARLFNNADWLRGLRLMDFLRDTGKHFTVSYMLQKESVKSRLDAGISFTEFSYMLVQAYDYEHLYRTEGCELQLGGSDQWGNITSGIELIGRRHRAEVHGLTVPLLTTAVGQKFGKSEGENVWLDPRRTSPYRFYQFWINQDDRDVERLLRSFTFLSEPEVAGLMAEHAADPAKRSAQRRLAADLTARIHGSELLDRVEAASRILFGGSDIREADAGTLETVASEVPRATIDRGELRRGGGSVTVVDALVRTGLAPSKAEARRGIQGGGYTLNGERVAEDRALRETDLLGGRYIVLQRGRRNFAVVVAE